MIKCSDFRYKQKGFEGCCAITILHDFLANGDWDTDSDDLIVDQVYVLDKLKEIVRDTEASKTLLYDIKCPRDVASSGAYDFIDKCADGLRFKVNRITYVVEKQKPFRNRNTGNLIYGLSITRVSR